MHSLFKYILSDMSTALIYTVFNTLMIYSLAVNPVMYPTITIIGLLISS